MAKKTETAPVEDVQVEKTETAPVENLPIRKSNKVKIYVPKTTALDDPNVLIAVNGVNYVIPRGKEVEVPEAIAKEFYRAQKAQSMWDERSASMVAN